MDYRSYSCGCSGEMVPVLYGYPDTKMIEHARGGLIALGGCSVSSATHYCYSCNTLYQVKNESIIELED